MLDDWDGPGVSDGDGDFSGGVALFLVLDGSRQFREGVTPVDQGGDLAVFDPTRTTVSLSLMRYHDGLVGLMRGGGFSYDLIHHALHALGSRVLGFSQELFDPGAGSGGAAADASLASIVGQLPYLAGMMAEIAHDDPDSTLGWCDDQTEFEFGLDLILNGLDGLRETL